ncbi:MAG TPA: VOC family protein [Herpetosiphonaceae bacterium]
MALSIQVVIDCADPGQLAPFWASALGYKIQDPPQGFDSWPEFLTSIGVPESEWNSASAIIDPDGKGARIYFQRVPEPKTVKNRLHLDLNASGGHGLPVEERRVKVGEAVERLQSLGATKIREMELRGEYWIVMADPEGNEFCVQ